MATSTQLFGSSRTLGIEQPILTNLTQPSTGRSLSPSVLDINRSLISNSTSLSSSSRITASAPVDPGNTRSTALNVGSLGRTPIKILDSVSSTDRNDYIQFNVTGTTNLSLSLAGLRANANLQLLDANGVVLAQSARSGTASESINRSVNSGTYYARVYQATGTTNYTLNLSGTAVTAPPPSPSPAPSSSDFVQQVLALTNQFRAQNQLAPLTLNVELNAAALGHSRDMALRDYFSHTGLNGSTLSDRARAVGYAARSLGENIAAGQTTPATVVQGWINSPGHRANLLNPSFTELGVGYYHLTNDTGSINYNHYWTQLFGSGDTNPSRNLPA